MNIKSGSLIAFERGYSTYEGVIVSENSTHYYVSLVRDKYPWEKGEGMIIDKRYSNIIVLSPPKSKEPIQAKITSKVVDTEVVDEKKPWYKRIFDFVIKPLNPPKL